MATYLDAIVRAHRTRAAADTRSQKDLDSSVADAAPVRDFLAGITSAPGGFGVIAEIKRRSPSAGRLREHLDPATTARHYEQGGANCLSVLTDAEHFGGSPADLRVAKAAVAIPVLRKDFTVAKADLYDARAMGADAVLLIVAALSDAELAEFIELSCQLSLCALVEIHDEEELHRAVSTGAKVIGVNQRDLHNFEVDTDRALRLRPAIPDGIVAVAESGVDRAEGAARLAHAGYDAVLVGSAFVTASDPEAAVRSFCDSARVTDRRL